MTNKHEHWLQRVRYTAAEPTSWLSHARTLRQAAEDLWLSGNAHSRNPGSELGATVLANWTSPDFVPTETGGSTCDVCLMVFGFALENLARASSFAVTLAWCHELGSRVGMVLGMTSWLYSVVPPL